MKCLWAVQLRQNQNRWIIYQFVTGHRLVQTPPAPCLSCCLSPFFFPWLCSAQSVNLTANQACPHCRENGEKAPVCNPPSHCVCLLCRSMMPNFSKWPSHACVPSLEPCRPTLWMPVLERPWRNRFQWTHRATSIPNPLTLPSEWSEESRRHDVQYTSKN